MRDWRLITTESPRKEITIPKQMRNSLSFNKSSGSQVSDIGFVRFLPSATHGSLRVKPQINIFGEDFAILPIWMR